MNQQIADKSLDCVHCGLCLNVCPTYLATGRENSSPRGRIYLMRGAAEGRIPLEGLLVEEASLCLGCLACETACPSGVEYRSLLEHTRADIEEAKLRKGWGVALERFLLRHVIPHRGRLRAVTGLLALLQRSGLDQLGASLLGRLPGATALAASLDGALELAPAIPPASARQALPAFTPAEGERRGQVAFFEGCIMPELFGATNRATLRVLAKNGFDVTVPAGQGCCGALLAHRGDALRVGPLAERNARAFAAADLVVTNSAGCGNELRSAEYWQGQDAAPRVLDVSELLAEVGLRTAAMQQLSARVCYDDPCHLVHGQGVRNAPRQLLTQIPGIELVPHAEPEACCGAAGIYNMSQPQMSRTVLDRKLDHLAAANPDFIASGNPGCLMQLSAGLRRRGLSGRALHPVELLDLAYREAPMP